jgi:SAM-dependent methyltransferase
MSLRRRLAIKTMDLSTRDPIRPLVRALAGDRGARCPCCGLLVKRFAPLNEPDRSCWVCKSLERHRAVKLYFGDHPELVRSGMKVLHVAPEKALRMIFTSIPGVEYQSGDLFADLGPETLDVTDLSFPDASFDAVICNHVLEHVPDDRKAMRELRRVLRPGGWALLLVPDLEWNTALTDEEPLINDPAEQERRFGQHDHVRRYGWDYVERLEEAGFEVDVVRQEQEFSPQQMRRYRLARGGFPEPLFFGRTAAQ